MPTPNPTDHPVGLRYSDRLQMAAQARTEAIEALGDGTSTALTSLMGPMGEGPDWPAGPAWRAIRREGRLLIFSDGLSDPWVERNRPETGLGLEVFIDSPQSGLPDDAPLFLAADTWLFPMLAEISHILAGHHRLRDTLLESGFLSMGFAIDHLKDGRGRAGALLNVAAAGLPTTIQLPGGEVRLVAVTLLTPEEMTFLRGGGATAREELAAKLQAAGVGHWSLPRRASVV
ncbi:hypothetical protein [Methylomagnum sp.]